MAIKAVSGFGMGCTNTTSKPQNLRTPRLVSLFLFLGITVSTKASTTTFVRDQSQFNQAVIEASPGSEIIWVNGNYTNIHMIMNVSGTNIAPITIRSQTPGGVTFNATCSLKVTGNHIHTKGLRFSGGTAPSSDVVEISGSDCLVTNCLFEDMTTHEEDQRIDYLEIGGSNNEVHHCTFGNRTRRGNMIVVDLGDTLPSGPSANHHFHHNYFHNYHRPTGDVSSTNGFETVRIGNSGTALLPANVTFDHNYFLRCSGETEIISNKSSGSTLCNNTFVECLGSLSLRHGHGNLVEGNVFIGNHVRGTGGIRIMNRNQSVRNNVMKDLYSEGKTDAAISISAGVGNPDPDPTGWDQVVNATISGNTIINVNRSIFVGAQFSSRNQPLLPIESTISNNIIQSSKRPFVEYVRQFSGISYQGNIGYGNEIGDAPASGFTIQSIDSNAEPVLHPTDVGVDWIRTPAAAAGLIEFSEAGSVRETDEPTGSAKKSIQFSLQRIRGSQGAVSIRCYIPAFSQGQPDAGTPNVSTVLTWQDGDTSPKNVRLEILSDHLAEGDETVHIAFDVISGEALPGARASACVHIADYPFYAWRASEFEEDANTPQAADLADFDEDGIPNLMEYALDADGDDPDPSVLPSMHTDQKNSRTIRFEINPDAEFINFHVERAPTPGGPWTTAATYQSGAANWNSPYDITYSSNSGQVRLTIPPGESRAFWRLGAGLQHR